MPTNSKLQADSILARFPGPVVLHFSRRRVFVMLAIYLAALAFVVWLAANNFPWDADTFLERRDFVMILVSIPFWTILAGRAVLILLFPDAASLTLTADGFILGHVLHRTRRSWWEVSEFAVMKRYLMPGRYGGRVEQILYETPEASSGKRNGPRVLADLYGQPRMKRADLVHLMNEWRRRALAQDILPAPSPISPSSSRVPVINGARR